MIYNLEQRIFFVKTYYEKKSIVAVQRAYKAKYREKIDPSRTSILAEVKILEKNGSVTAADPRKGCKSDKREKAGNALERLIEENGSISARKAASALQVSCTLILTIYL